MSPRPACPCVPRVRRPARPARLQRQRERCRAVGASRGRAGWERHPERIRCRPGTHRARPGAHGEFRRHGQSRREPKRTRGPGDPPELHHGRTSLLKRGDQVQSRKKGPPRFSKKNKTQTSPNPTPLRPPIHSTDLPIKLPNRSAYKHTNKPQTYLAPAHRSAYIGAPTAPGSSAGPAVQSLVIPNPPLAPSVPADRSAPASHPDRAREWKGRGGSCAQADSRGSPS